MKQGWEKKWVVLEDMKLSLYDNEDTCKEIIIECFSLCFKEGIQKFTLDMSH